MKSIITVFALLFPLVIFSQVKTISGKVTDKSTGEGLSGARITVKGTQQGTLADESGVYRLKLTFAGDESFMLVASYLGYLNKNVEVTRESQVVDFQMENTEVFGKEVVITGSRVSETIMESPVSIDKMNAREISNAASGDFYQTIGNLKGIDVVSSSIGMKSINMRGFNSTSPVRAVQFIDGVDNQAPGLNFPVGNLVGVSALDLQSVEVISGAASALYGPNAFQGVISMNTKSPFEHEGISVMLKAGTRPLGEADFRYARTLGQKRKFAFKVTAGYMAARDWPATDTVANLYGNIETDVNLSSIIQQQQYDSTLTVEDRDDWEALNNYLDFNPLAWPGKINIEAPGYMEPDLANYNSNSLKLGSDLRYKFTDSLELSYMFKFGMGTAVYQGTNRYSINDIRFQQHKIELKGKNFFVKAYHTGENAGDSYDVVFTGINIAKAGIGEYVADYLKEYFSVIDSLTNGFDGDARQWMVDSASSAARIAAGNAWFKPGSAQFDSVFNEIIRDSDLQKGSKFVDRSSLQHLEGQYDFRVDNVHFNVGANVRRYDPQSFGTIFSDTLQNPGDTLLDGSHRPDAKYDNISLWEAGAFGQVTARFLDDRLKVIGSLRADKNQNFKLQFSPRISAVFSQNDHNVRISVQSAFRSPTLQNQYILLNLGPIKLGGNLNGWTNLYTWDSVEEFLDVYDSTYVIDPGVLQTTGLPAIKPEQIKSLEVGYRGIIDKKLFIDFTAYFNIYSDFIGNIRVVQPFGDAEAGEESGVNALLTNTGSNQTYQLWQLPTNAKQDVFTFGTAIGVSYYFGKGYSGLFNYTYSGIDTRKLTDPIIPGFNTPAHKFNIGATGRDVWKNLGFSVNFKWVSKYRWESSFGDGDVPSYYLLDAQVSYRFDKIYSTLRIGGSNILNNRHTEAWGSPRVGGMGYISWTLELDKNRGDWPFKTGKSK